MKQAGVHPEESKASSCIMVACEDKCCHYDHSLLPFSSPLLYMLSTRSYGLEYALGLLESAVLAVSPHNSLSPPACSLVKGLEDQKRSWVSARCKLLKLTPYPEEQDNRWTRHQVYIICNFITKIQETVLNTKHTGLPKINAWLPHL